MWNPFRQPSPMSLPRALTIREEYTINESILTYCRNFILNELSRVAEDATIPIPDSTIFNIVNFQPASLSSNEGFDRLISLVEPKPHQQTADRLVTLAMNIRTMMGIQATDMAKQQYIQNLTQEGQVPLSTIDALLVLYPHLWVIQYLVFFAQEVNYDIVPSLLHRE